MALPHKLYDGRRAHMRHTLQEVIKFIVEVNELALVLFPLGTGPKLIVALLLLFLIRYCINLILLDMQQRREGYTIIKLLVLHRLEVHFESFQVY